MRKDRRYPAKQRWRCTVPGCPGRADTVFTDPPTVLRSTDHNHIPDEEAILRKRTKHVLCDAAKNRPLVPLSQVSAWYIILSMHPRVCEQKGNMRTNSSRETGVRRYWIILGWHKNRKHGKGKRAELEARQRETRRTGIASK